MTAEKHLAVREDTELSPMLKKELINESYKKLKIKEKTFTNTKKAKTPLPVGTMFMAVICALLLLFIVFVTVQVSDYSSQVSELSNELKALVEAEEGLNYELSQKNDLQYIEEQAQAMGMVKEDKLPKKYVTVAAEDSSAVLNANDDNDYSLSAIFSALGDSLGDILEYIGG